MRITSTGSTPPAIAPTSPGSGVTAKAIAAFNDPSKVQAVQRALSGNPVTAPAQSEHPNHSVNANNISPEELSAVKQSSNETPDKEVETEVVQEVSQERPEAKKVDPQLSKQFAQLARQEKILRQRAQQQEQALKAREAALAAKEAELSQKSQIDTKNYISRDELKRNTLQKLAEAGVTYEELTQQILNTTPTDPRTEATISELKAQIQELKQTLDKSKQETVESQQQAYNTAKRQIKADVVNLVKMDPAFETVKATNSVDDVVDLITKTFEKDGILLSVEEATQEVENYLVEEALKLTRIGKIQKQLQGKMKQAVQPAPSQKQADPEAPKMKTLTNATSGTRKLTNRERAMLAFKGELKQ